MFQYVLLLEFPNYFVHRILPAFSYHLPAASTKLYGCRIETFTRQPFEENLCNVVLLLEQTSDPTDRDTSSRFFFLKGTAKLTFPFPSIEGRQCSEVQCNAVNDCYYFKPPQRFKASQARILFELNHILPRRQRKNKIK